MSEVEDLYTGWNEANVLVLSRLVAEVARLQRTNQGKWLDQFHSDLFVDLAKAATIQSGKPNASPRTRAATTATIDVIVGAARVRLPDLGDQPKPGDRKRK